MDNGRAAPASAADGARRPFPEPVSPMFADRVPYGIAVADLGDGIRMLGNYLGADLGALACGLPVRARYERSGGHGFLGWVPAGTGPAR